MGNIGIDFEDVSKFFTGLQTSMLTSHLDQKSGNATATAYAKNIGAVGTPAAWLFKIHNAQANRAMASFINDAKTGQVALANAVGLAGIAYKNGDVKSSDTMSPVVDQMLSPRAGTADTVRNPKLTPEEQAAASKTPALPAGLTLNEKGDVVDSKGNVIVSAAKYSDAESDPSAIQPSGASTAAAQARSATSEASTARTGGYDMHSNDQGAPKPTAAQQETINLTGTGRQSDDSTASTRPTVTSDPEHEQGVVFSADSDSNKAPEKPKPAPGRRGQMLVE